MKKKEDELSNNTKCNRMRIYLFASLLMLSEQMIEDSTVLLVNPLHLVDVLSHLLHPNQSLN